MNKLRFAVIIVLAICFAYCGEQKKESNKSGGATLLQDGMDKVDLTIIDPQAAVVKVELIATGNTMAEMKYDKDFIVVPNGTTIELTLINQSTDGAMQHNFVLIEKGSEDAVGTAAVKAGPASKYIPDLFEVLVGSDMTGPGETTTINFMAPKKGTYRFMCTYPGHYTIMQGDFTVE